MVACPPKAVAIFFYVKACMENLNFRVFIKMIRINQTHIFLKEYVPIHQIGRHFVGGYWLDFSPTEQETKTSIL